jgi:hypothetical protein
MTIRARWARDMSRLACATAFLTLLEAVAYGQDIRTWCSCPIETTALYRNSGGDSSQLQWRYEAYQKSPASAQLRQTICYLRSVENRSVDYLTDILWDVAGYTQDTVPARATRGFCNDYPGEMKSAPEQGPLYYNVPRQPYPTTVLPPESGWYPKKAAASTAEASPSLRADFLLDTRDRDGRLRPTHVTIESTASYDGKLGFLSIDVANDGESALGVFLNIPLKPEMYADIPIAEKPYFLQPKQRVIFKTLIPERPEFAPATVVFYGGDGKQAAMGTAGFYVPTSGKPQRSDEDLWKPAR